MRQYFTWKKAIAAAKKSGHFDESAREFADDWNVCAVGFRIEIENPEINLRICRGDSAASDVLTTPAYNLGMRFRNAVHENDVEEAETVYRAIQKLPRVIEPGVKA